MSDNKIALRLLSRDTLMAVLTTCVNTKGILVSLKTEISDTLASIDTMIYPINSKRSVLQSSNSELISATRLIPSTIIAVSPQLGDISTLVDMSVSSNSRNNINELDRIDRMISVRAEKENERLQIDDAILFLDSIIADINVVLTE